MRTQAWIEKIAESSRARTLSFFVFALLIGSFTFLTFHANADLAVARESRVTLAQQREEIGTAGSLNDFYDQGWLADEQNFSKLAGYADQLISFAASRTLDPQFRQELSDYLLKNQARLPQESSRIASLSFSDGILKQDQARLLDLYDELNIVFQTMQGILTHWDQDTPLDRIATMRAFQDEFSTASIEFQATRRGHERILNYARQLEEGSKQASTTELDRIHANRTLFTRSLISLTVSLLAFSGWLIFLADRRRRNRKDLGSIPG